MVKADDGFRGCDDKTGKLISNEELRDEHNVQPHLLLRPGTIHDDLAWKILITKVPKYRMYDSKEWYDYT